MGNNESGFSEAEKKDIKRTAEERDQLSTCIAGVVSLSILFLLVFIFLIYFLILYANDSTVITQPTTVTSASLATSNSIQFNISTSDSLTRDQFLQLSPSQLKRKRNLNATIPSNAIKISDHLYYLGDKVFQGVKVKGFVIVHHTKDSQNITKKRSSQTSDPNTIISDSDAYGQCSAFLASGTRWKGVVPNFVINYYNPFGFSVSYIESIVVQAMSTWQSVLTYQVFGMNDPSLLPQTNPNNEPDGINEISFGTISTAGVIAHTIVWGIFSGPVGSRQIYEADIVFNQEMPFSSTVTSNTYWFPDICTHEHGHYIGLADIYDSACSFVTMYGYASFGETHKTQLSICDIEAIQFLYGESNSTVTSTPSPNRFATSSSSISKISNILLLIIILFFLK